MKEGVRCWSGGRVVLVTRKTVDAGQMKEGVRCWSEGRVIWPEGRRQMLVTRKTVDAGQSEGRCSVLVLSLIHISEPRDA